MSGVTSGSLSSSWGNRIPVGSPTHRLLSSWEAGKTPSSLEGDRDSILNALNVFDREGELCRNYTCCGRHLEDLHALLEHFEEVHIIVLDRDAPNAQAHIQIPFNPQVNELTPAQQAQLRQRRQQQQQLFGQPRQSQNSSFDPDDMELELDLDNTTTGPSTHPNHPPPSAGHSISSHSSPSSGAPSPPDTPISTPLSAYPSPHAFVPSHLPGGHLSPYISQPSSPLSGTAASTRQSSPTGSASGGNSTIRANLNLNLSYHPRSQLSSPAILAHPEEAFNTYARFSSDYSSGLPGAQFNGASVDEASALTWQQVQALQQAQQQNQQQQVQNAQMQQQMNGCLPPALLFAPSSSCTPAGTPGTSRVPSPAPSNHIQQSAATDSSTSGHSKALSSNAQGSTTSPHRHGASNAGTNSTHGHNHPSHSANNSASSNAPGPSASSSSHPANPSAPAGLLRPASSLLLSKPFRCPKPNCNKSYKQANGLKYHMTHGSCNFAPPKDLEHVKDLLERKRRERDAQVIANGGQPVNRSLSTGTNLNSNQQGQIGGLPTTLDTALLNSYYDLNLQSMNITETELREVEREAEKRLRPFACGVGDCQRRYKNMNGLRYHYQHSGEHGAVGLALLASGQHECLQNNHSGKRREQHHHSNSSGTNHSVHNASNHNQNAMNNYSSHMSNSTPVTPVATSSNNNPYGTTTFAMDEEREGRKRFPNASAFVKMTQGSASVPVSRAASSTRTGTPIPINVPASANTSPKGNPSMHIPSPPSTNASLNTIPTSSTSSLSGALGTSSMTTPIQVVPVHVQQVNGVGINTGLPPTSPPSSAAPTATSPVQHQGTTGSPGQQQVTQQQMQQMAAAAYQQYAQQFQRQYQAAMQMHAAQQQQAVQQAQQGQPQPQQSQGDWAVGMAMDMS